MTVEESELSTLENLGATNIITQKRVKKSCSRLKDLNPRFILTPIGILKFLQIAMASVFLLILVDFRVKYILVIGFSLKLLFTGLVTGIILSTALSLCYALSSKSYSLVRSTIFELQCNGLFAGLFLFMSVFLWVYSDYDLIIYHLHPRKFEIHDVLLIIEVYCFILGLLYSIDAILCFVHYSRSHKQSKKGI